MKALFLADCRRELRTEKVSNLEILKLFFKSFGIKALFGYRLGRYLLQLGESSDKFFFRLCAWPIYWLVSSYARIALDIRLELSADIGPGLYIGHFGNISLRHCKLGEGCSIAQSVQIMPTDGADGPQIGDRVWIGGHARIIGAYRIGSKCTIGAGATVKRDIPEGALFMGSPGRVVMRDYDNSAIL